MDKLDDFLRYSTLFLYYGELFSKKQKQYLELYLEEDRSLSEISEEYFTRVDVLFPYTYLATYLWVREGAAHDALIHFGTHGTQEWLPAVTSTEDMVILQLFVKVTVFFNRVV